MPLRRRLAPLALALTLALSLPQPSAVAAAAFTDVPADSFASEYILNLSERGVLGGFPDGSFRPSNSLTRAEALKIVLRAAGTPIQSASATTFTDVPQTHTLLNEIETARQQGITTGYADGTFRPDRPSSRGELVKLLMTATGLVQQSPIMSPEYRDLPATSSLAPAIYSARALGVASGFDDGTFRPDAPLTRAQAAKMVYSAILIKENKPLPGVSTAPASSSIELKLFELINASRAEQHLPPLILDPTLSQIARAHSQDLMDTFKRFDKEGWSASHDDQVGPWLTHDSGDGTSFEKRLQQALTLAKVSSAGATENVGWATYNARSPEDAVRVIHEAMMAEVPPDDGHRKNILGQSVATTHVGVGIVAGEDPKELYVTTDFVLKTP